MAFAQLVDYRSGDVIWVNPLNVGAVATSTEETVRVWIVGNPTALIVKGSVNDVMGRLNEASRTPEQRAAYLWADLNA